MNLKMISNPYQSGVDKSQIMGHNDIVTIKDLMSSRCFISIFKGNFEYDSIFCADGHPEYAGYTLVHYYDRKPVVIRLIQDGDMSNLASTIIECKFYDDSFKSNRTFSSMDSMIEFYRECGCDYGYVYVDDDWQCLDISSSESSFVNLNLLINA